MEMRLDTGSYIDKRAEQIYFLASLSFDTDESDHSEVEALIE